MSKKAERGVRRTGQAVLEPLSEDAFEAVPPLSETDIREALRLGAEHRAAAAAAAHSPAAYPRIRLK